MHIDATVIIDVIDVGNTVDYVGGVSTNEYGNRYQDCSQVVR